MDCDTGGSGGARHPPFAGGHKTAPSSPSTTAVQARCSTKCALPPEPPLLDDSAGIEPPLRSWSDLPLDILGVVAGRLPRSDDRASLRSVCRAWRAAARLHRPPPPPLPLLVLADFSLAVFCADGAVAGTRRRVSLPDREVAAADDVRCVGSFEGWLVGVRLNKGRYFGDARCFLINAFSREFVRLPPPSVGTNFIDACSRSLPIVNGFGTVHCTVNAGQYVMSFRKVVLSSSPDSSSCLVAAVSVHRTTAKLALWRQGMTSWCVCHGGCISKFSDIALYQGKLYIFSKLTTNLVAFDISEEDDSGLMVSRIERCMTQLPDVDSQYEQRWNFVEWNGKLLLVATYYLGAHTITGVGVFEVDFGTNPIRFTEIRSLDGDCIFISPCSSQSFRACQYDEVEGDLIYFIDGSLNPAKRAPPCDKFVYNIRDGTMAPFAVGISEDNLRAPDGTLMYPTWLFPS